LRLHEETHACFREKGLTQRHWLDEAGTNHTESVACTDCRNIYKKLRRYFDMHVMDIPGTGKFAFRMTCADTINRVSSS